MYYEYQAYSVFSDMSLHINENYVNEALRATIIASFFAFALALFAAIAIKKARPLGIITAIMQPVGLFSAMKTVIAYASIDFSALEMTATSYVSMNDAMSKLYDRLADAFLEKIMPQLFAMAPWGFLTTATFVVSLIYFINISGKSLPAYGYGRAALIISIVRYALISPIEMFSLLLEQGSQGTQSIWDIFFRFFVMIPLIFAALQGLCNIIVSAKARRQSAQLSADDNYDAF